MPTADADVLLDDPVGEPDPELLKGFNRQFVTGVTVVTTCDEDAGPGLAVNAYARSPWSHRWSWLRAEDLVHLGHAVRVHPPGINILSADQLDTVGRFSRPGPDKFAALAWHAGPAGSPSIDNSAAALEAEIRERFQAKTHTIFVCRVRHAEIATTTR